MNEDEARDRARALVNDEMLRAGFSPAELARRADVDSDTVNDFISGRRWPQYTTRAKIARALNWTPESIDAIVRGGLWTDANAETVSPSDQDGVVLLDMPPEVLDGLTPAERDEVVTAAKLSALQTAREIRRRLES